MIRERQVHSLADQYGAGVTKLSNTLGKDLKD